MADGIERRDSGMHRLKRREGRPAAPGGFDLGNLLKVSAEDVQGEVEQFQKSRLRLEKANEKLLKELEETTKKNPNGTSRSKPLRRFRGRRPRSSRSASRRLHSTGTRSGKA